MTVRELIVLLSKVDQNLPVWTSSEYELPLTRDALVVEEVQGIKALVIAA
jgi:hypothetical protein